MHPGFVGLLEQQRAELKASLAETDRRLKTAHGAQQRAEQARVRAWEPPPHVRRTALIVYVLADYATEPAAQFLSRQGRMRGWPDKTAEGLAALVENLFEQAHVDDASGLVALTDAENSSDPSAFEAAAPYLEEWRLFAWSRRLNVEKGVAPSTSSLLQQAVANRLVRGHASPQALGTVAESRARMWATRFRRRWGGRFGVIPECEGVSTAELLSKAFRSINN